MATSAGEIGRLIRRHATLHGNAGLGQQSLGRPVGRGRAQLQGLPPQQQAGGQAPGPEGQGQLHRGCSAPTNAQRAPGGLRLAPGQEGLERFHGDGGIGHRGNGAQIQAEDIPAQGGAPLQLQLAQLQL